MIDIDFSNVTLKKTEISLLRNLSKEKECHFSNDYRSLIVRGFVEYASYKLQKGVQTPATDILKISEKGKAYLIYVRRSKLKYWIPIIIADALSVAALIVSVIK